MRADMILTSIAGWGPLSPQEFVDTMMQNNLASGTHKQIEDGAFLWLYRGYSMTTSPEWASIFLSIIVLDDINEFTTVLFVNTLFGRGVGISRLGKDL